MRRSLYSNNINIDKTGNADFLVFVDIWWFQKLRWRPKWKRLSSEVCIVCNACIECIVCIEYIECFECIVCIVCIVSVTRIARRVSFCRYALLNTLAYELSSGAVVYMRWHCHYYMVLATLYVTCDYCLLVLFNIWSKRVVIRHILISIKIMLLRSVFFRLFIGMLKFSAVL
jgi:hypothetical protein